MFRPQLFQGMRQYMTELQPCNILIDWLRFTCQTDDLDRNVWSKLIEAGCVIITPVQQKKPSSTQKYPVFDTKIHGSTQKCPVRQKNVLPSMHQLPLPLSGAGRMITSKPSLRSGFDCIIRPAPSGTGRTTPSQPGHYPLSKQTIIGSVNGLSLGQCQAIIWTNAGILLIGPLGTSFSEM